MVASKPGSADETYSEDTGPHFFAKIALKNKEGNLALFKSCFGNNIILDRGVNDEGYSSDDPKIKAALELVSIIKYWESGYTYYWFDIQHIGSDLTNIEAGIGKYGLVRNQWYEFTINSVNGL